MTKEYYKKLIDKYLEEDIFNGTNKCIRKLEYI